MISFFESELTDLSVHWVGNKSQDEGMVFSDRPTSIHESQSSSLMYFFLSPFEKQNEVYSFYNLHKSSLNVIDGILAAMGTGSFNFHEGSQNIAKALHEASNHPKIKAGHLYVAQFSNVQFEGELFNAVGIFKSESQDTYLQVNPSSSGFDISFHEAKNIDKLDKGCLILLCPDTTHKVLCVDNRGTKDAAYWKDEFLRVNIVNNDYNQTATTLQFCKHFINDILPMEYEMSQADKADILNRSIKYFKEKESFDLEEFTTEVIQDQFASEKFVAQKSIYDEDFDLDTPANFNISSAAVKKQTSKFKPTIKLDKNFTIYAYGDRQLMEKGYDEEKMMSFYKVYFVDEHN